jgi:4-hydroxy-4-methyl-2-oxoglutarate aldolase
VYVRKIAQDALEELRKYDSATIANVIELFDLRATTSGYARSSIRSVYPELPPIVGYATTATFRSAFPTASPDAYLKVPAHVEEMQLLPEPRVVVIQDLDESPTGAVLGEVMCRVYRKFGCSGAITNGAVRDILAVRRLGFPLFASAVIVSHGYPRLEEIHSTINISGLTIRPGDILHADANGVVLVPNDIAEHVASACNEFVALETQVIDYLDREDATPKGYRKAEEAAAAEFSRLSTKLRGRFKSN